MWRGQGIRGRGHGKAPSAGKASRRGFPPASLGHGKCGVRAPPRALAAGPRVRRIDVAGPLGSTASRGRARRAGTGPASGHEFWYGFETPHFSMRAGRFRLRPWKMPPNAGQAWRRGIPALEPGGLGNGSPGATRRPLARAGGMPWQGSKCTPADTKCIASGQSRPPFRRGDSFHPVVFQKVR